MEIEFKRCETSSYSPWHLEIAKNLEVPLWCNSEIGYFVKVGDYHLLNENYIFDDECEVYIARHFFELGLKAQKGE